VSTQSETVATRLEAAPEESADEPIWLRNCWQVAAFASEVGRSILPRMFLGQPVILYRGVGGEPVAMEDRCPHRLVPLSIGTLDGPVIRCGYHGLEFGTDGKCVRIPGQDEIPTTARVRTFPVLERHSLIWIWMGERQLANPTLVPDVHWLNDPAWVPSTGYHRMEADYRLITDNLLDLSHESYVHQKTIGNESVADSPAHVSVEHERIVRADREMHNIVPPPYFARIMASEDRIDRWQSAIYMPPGIHMTEAGVHKVGTDRSKAYVGRVLHLLTPETKTSSHYFWAMNRNYRLEDAELTEFIRVAVQHTLDEDQNVLELQMRAVLKERPTHFPPLAIRADSAPIRARRLLRKLVKGEIENNTAVAAPMPLAHEPPGALSLKHRISQ
jgi:vanillate O-demethylase monooxygenase subunit